MEWKKQRLPKPIKTKSDIGPNFDDEEQTDDDLSWCEDLLYDEWRENQILKDIPRRW